MNEKQLEKMKNGKGFIAANSAPPVTYNDGCYGEFQNQIINLHK